MEAVVLDRQRRPFHGHQGSVEAKLRELAALGKGQGTRVDAVKVRGDAAEEILKFSVKRDVDLIVMKIERKGLMERAFFGSTAERVIREARFRCSQFLRIFEDLSRSLNFPVAHSDEESKLGLFCFSDGIFRRE